MRLYLSGAVSYNPEKALRDFNEAEKYLLPYFDVFNPARYCKEHGLSGWKECMQAVFPKMLDCDGVAVVDSHNSSIGRDIEVYAARLMCMQVKSVAEWRVE